MLAAKLGSLDSALDHCTHTGLGHSYSFIGLVVDRLAFYTALSADSITAAVHGSLTRLCNYRNSHSVVLQASSEVQLHSSSNRVRKVVLPHNKNLPVRKRVVSLDFHSDSY